MGQTMIAEMIDLSSMSYIFKRNKANTYQGLNLLVKGLGANTLTIEEISANITINNIVVDSSSTSVFKALKGAALHIDHGSVVLRASKIIYEVNGASSISVEASTFGFRAGLETVRFSGEGGGSFSYEPGFLPQSQYVEVNGFSVGNKIIAKNYELDRFEYDQKLNKGSLILKKREMCKLYKPIKNDQQLTFIFIDLNAQLAAHILETHGRSIDKAYPLIISA